MGILEDFMRQQAEAQAQAQAQAKRDAILAMGMSLLGTRKGREMEGLSRAGLLGLATARNTNIQQGPSLRDLLAMQEYQSKQQEAQAAQAEQQAMRGAARASMIPATPGMPEYGPPTPAGGMQPAIAPTPDKFDRNAYVQRLYGMGRVNEAMAVEKMGAQESPFDKPKPENWTPESLAQYAQTRDPSVLKRYEAPKEPASPVGKVNASDFTPRSVDAFLKGGGTDYSLLVPIDKTPRTTISVDARGRGKAPEGFQWAPDGESLMPIPGGPKDTSQKDTARAANAVNRADIVIAKIDKALGQVGLKSAGFVGSIAANVPGTTAVDLKKNVDTVKANIGFQELQAMREASPTGGALGQVAVQELQMLQAVVSSLDTEQSPAQLRENLAQARKHFTNWKSIVKKAAESGAGRSAAGVIKFSDLPE